MAAPFFYEPDILPESKNYTLSEESSRHCIQVLRMKVGEHLNLTNGNGALMEASITIADKKHCTVSIQQLQITKPLQRKVSIALSPVKSNTRLEWFLEKATEIGISEIVPLICKRTERQHFRYSRMNGILISAMLQSQQSWLPVLHEPIGFESFVTRSSYAQKFIAHCMEEEKKELRNFTLATDNQLLIGPEGDFTQQEIQLAIENNYLPVSLGITRLRTETAALVGATLLMNL
jgi:16S rRNA (uracil1498-N3)-methyltransferase